MNKKEIFIKKSIKIHTDKWDYSFVDYLNNKTHIKIICPIHGIFKQRPDNHLQGNGCSKCYGNLTKTNNEFIKKSKEIWGDKWDYKYINYINARTPVKIKCPKHGFFEQIPNNHYRNGCPKCLLSKGENIILNWLKENNIKFEYQKIFKDLIKGKSYLRFDFFLTNLNIIIEYDGKQHFESVKWFGGEKEFKKRKRRDKIKEEWCKIKGIQLIRIPYWDRKIIKKILKEKLSN